ncbi:hypothetical protein FOVG_16565 [Fusarium oxysporum f. sp. pisi HDV247]|uniref:Uncharacterized protein n=1 Tax=Fusarium oxysporum f. sp. pisi HDV247 TaxID=1080344 RepID=W9NHD8_FUSOX|nr:hypothetical protein FOVG_16565 [Fusarium oxysporum f. sp. pisi HDV247]
MSLDLIIVRLLPNARTDAATFQNYIKGLEIHAYDQNISDVDANSDPTGAKEVPLGSASGVLTFNDGVSWSDVAKAMTIDPPQPGHKKKLPTGIIQHVKKQLAVGQAKAVATAVIVVDIDGSHKEYPTSASYDVRLDIKRNGVALEAPPIEWNASCYSVADLSPYPPDYMGIQDNPFVQPGWLLMKVPSIYALILAAPLPLPPGTAAVLLDQDGKPPPFGDLLKAVNLVLGNYDLQAGTTLEELSTPLTEAQSREIAAEIVYNRAWLPLPLPESELEDLYTSPDNNHDMARTKFEGNLAAYHAKLDADARRLAAYIFAASAAVSAERMSAASTVALFTFPLDPRMAPSTQSQSRDSTSGSSSSNKAELSVVLTSWDAFALPQPASPSLISPSFTVPAAYFYALGHQLSSSMAPDLRYRALVNSTPDYISTTIAAAVGEGVLRSTESTVTLGSDNFSIGTAQAVRRICALLPNVVNMLGGPTTTGTGSSLQPPQLPVLAMSLVSGLVTSWRDFAQPDSAFWTTSQFDSAEYLGLFLQIVVNGDPVLAPAIAAAQLIPPKIPPAAPGSPNTALQHAYELPRITTEGWKALFSGSGAALLPAWTGAAPGDTTSRVNAFVRRLQTLFAVAWQPPPGDGPVNAELIPVLDASPNEFQGLGEGGAGDVLATFLEANPAFSFEADWNDDAVDAAVLAAFPDTAALPVASSFADNAAAQLRRWLNAALKMLWTLVQVTNFSATTNPTPPPPVLEPYRRFAYMEALFSRGFVSADSIAALSVAQFAAALTGTVVESGDEGTIHALAIKLPHKLPTSGIEPGFGFAPANPGGAEALVNCIPAPSLDPLGKVAYLHEMLSAALPLGDVGDGNTESGRSVAGSAAVTTKALEELVAARRGAIGDLHAGTANLETCVPVVDLVLESLEYLGKAVVDKTPPPLKGVVYDTTSDPVRDLLGLSNRYGDGDNRPAVNPLCIPGLPPASELLAAIPQYSTPCIKLAQPAIYQTLQSTFTFPSLPYARQLDLVRSYLTCIGSDRFETVRRFRRDITEFALDPATDPPEWPAHVWRLPVRLGIALEYLGLSELEYTTLYVDDLDDTQVAGLYGVKAEQECDWRENSVVLTLGGFMEGLGLTYCELLELKSSGLVPFTLRVTHFHDDVVPMNSAINDSIVQSREPVEAISNSDCPPCCLSNWRINFSSDNDDCEVDIRGLLMRVAIFVRLWRTLNSGCHHSISFSRLADICAVLQLFNAAGKINPDFIRNLAALLMLIELFELPWSERRDQDDGALILGAPTPPGSSRSKVLVLWDTQNIPTPEDWNWVVSALLDAVHRHATRSFHCPSRGPDSLKITASNLDPLSRLAGFGLSSSDPTWYTTPVCTLRFAEVLSKICASRFTVGELLFLFTVQDHLGGDDPFPLAPLLETMNKPFSSLPDDEVEWSLEMLRMKLLCTLENKEETLRDEACDAVDWHRVEAIIRSAGYTSTKPPSPGSPSRPDLLVSLAEHFFPAALERSGHKRVDRSRREWTTRLDPSDTSPAMWAAEPCEPFHYRIVRHPVEEDAESSGELWVTLPLRDSSVLEKLQATRQLRLQEINAVQELYFAPRASLAPFALLFSNFERAVEYLVQAESEVERWRFFAREVLLFERRRMIIAKHLAMHVREVTSDEESKGRCGCDDKHKNRDEDEDENGHSMSKVKHHHHREGCEKCCSPADIAIASTLLKHLVADENQALTTWEDNSGAPPTDFQWSDPLFSGGALAALLGLAGTGLHGEFHAGGTATGTGNLRWEEMRGGLTAFGSTKDRWNCPVPTVIPRLINQLPSAEVRKVVSFKNGFAWRNRDGHVLAGVEPFECKWTGSLLVECAGCYVFTAGTPCDGDEGRPGCQGCDDEWSVTLQRGQKTYRLLNHHGGEKEPSGPSFLSHGVHLSEGAYDVTITYKQVDPRFTQENITHQHTGFEVRYKGPDTQSQCVVVPFRNLVRNSKDGPLGNFTEGKSSLSRFLKAQYVPTIRDARRTYQRAFKAVLLARRFCLSALKPKDWRCEDESEMEFLLRSGARFMGTAYYRGEETAAAPPGTSPYKAHHAALDLNLLPVSDPYLPPNPASDARAHPSPQRQAALFNVWERLFDYVHLRDEVRELHMHPALKHHHDTGFRSLWHMFREASAEHPPGSQTSDDAADLVLRYLGVDAGLKDALLNYFFLAQPQSGSGGAPVPSVYHVAAAPDLENERWVTRVWRARGWARRVDANFQTQVLDKSRPALWAADDDALEVEVLIPGDLDADGEAAPAQSGVANLVRFVTWTLLGIDPDNVVEGIISCAGSRLPALKHLNDGLRWRARAAILSFLCQMDRVPLPSGSDGIFSTLSRSASSPSDVGNLLLQDVEARLDERTTRVQDGIVSTQRLVQRLRIGLEPQFLLSPGDRVDLEKLWECTFASFDVWAAHARRTLYAENWATWDELRALDKTEAGKFLVQGLERDSSTLVKQGRPVWFPATGAVAGEEPSTAGLELEQASRDLANLGSHKASTLENLLLLATPDNAPRPTLLSAGITTVADTSAATTAQLKEVARKTFGLNLPFWIESAIRLGSRFIRVAAAGLPPAFPYKGPTSTDGCSCCRDTSCPPPVDEYYFWLAPVGLYDPSDAPQDADIRTSSADDPTAPAWESPNAEVDEADAQNPGSLNADPNAPKTTAQLLSWAPRQAVALFWACVHNGCLLAPRRSGTYLKLELLPKGASLFLQLAGRCADSLFFTAAGTPPTIPPSRPLGTALGFRYDMATNSAVAVPQALPDVFASTPIPPTKGPLAPFAAYPRFVFFSPGAPLAPATAFGAALAIAERLRDTCCFEAALEWYRAAFDPLSRDNSWALCRRYSISKRGGDVLLEGITTEDKGKGKAAAGVEPTAITRDPSGTILDSPCCPATADPAKQPRIVRSRAVLLEYLETLLRWADSVADTSSEAENTSTSPSAEATQQALVLVEAMAYILGPSPKAVVAHPNPQVERVSTVSLFTPASPPLNPRLLRLYDQVADRMDSLRRRQRFLSLPDRPATTAAISCLPHTKPPFTLPSAGPGQPYRFTSVYPKAAELAGLVRSLASSLTSAYERGDNTYLMALRASHERTLLELGLSTAQQQWRTADWEVQALGQSMQAALARRHNYVMLRDGGLNAGEQAHVTGTETAMGSNTAANVSEGLGQVFSMIPDLATGVAGMGPLVKTELPIGTKMAAATGAAARVLNTVAAISSSQAGLSLTQSGWDRRLIEWRLQADLAAIEIAQIKRQRLAAERRRAVALRELNSHQRQKEHAEEVLAFERDRQSRHALFLFLQQETAGLLRTIFALALRTAREAHAAFLFERVPPSPMPPFPSFAELWNDHGGNSSAQGNAAVHAGLMAGERLELALRRLERSYMSLNGRELELSKRISLRESFPREFIALRQRGSCVIELQEAVFDADYPGHYLRRLRSVSVSVPCVAGMYTGVHCRLQLLASSIRTEPLMPSQQECCCCSAKKPCNTGRDSCCNPPWHQEDPSCGKGGVDVVEDPYVVHRFGCASASASAVATSHGQDDSGLFELTFRDERYLPFEFEGAVSRWRIELPRRHNLFDFSSLSDVVLSLNYTARDGGPRLRTLAEEKLGGCISCGGGEHSKSLWRGFEVRREFPDLWPRFERCGNECDDCRRHLGFHGGRHGAGCCESSCNNSCDHNGSGHQEHQEHHSGHNQAPHDHCHVCEDDCAPRPPLAVPCPHTFDVPLHLRRGMFPYLPGRKPVRVTSLCLSVSLRRLCRAQLDRVCKCPRKTCAGRHFPVLFVPPGKEHCPKDWRAVECVERTAVGDLYGEEGEDGVCAEDGAYDDVFSCEIGNLAMGPIAEETECGYGAREQETWGSLRFPRCIGDVVEVWLLCGYDAVVSCCDADDRKAGETQQRSSHGGRCGSDGRRRRQYFIKPGGQMW